MNGLLDDVSERCRHCGRVIERRTFGSKNWEPDYDPHDDPVIWRHADGYAGCGVSLLGSFAGPRPMIVTLCGSTRFKDEFIKATRDLTLAGVIVISVGLFGHSGDLAPGEVVRGHPVKGMLDELHKRKIDIADAIAVIDVDGYVGESTSGEIEYAREQDKGVYYMSSGWMPKSADLLL